MIHFRQDGEFFKLGLNLQRAPGGFVAMWVWFDFAKAETFCARLRIRLHRRPFIMRSVQRVNLIDGYMDMHGLEMVQREVLQDLRAIEENQKRRNERFSYIKP